LQELGGRIVDRDGVLWIRDWEDWQPPTTSTERSKKHRRNVAATSRQQERDTLDKEEERDKDTTGTNGKWEPFEQGVAGHFGRQTTYSKRGKPKAFVGQLAAVFGNAANRDVTAACAMLDEWVGHERLIGGWQYVTQRNAVERSEKWLNGRKVSEPATLRMQP